MRSATEVVEMSRSPGHFAQGRAIECRECRFSGFSAQAISGLPLKSRFSALSTHQPIVIRLVFPPAAAVLTDRVRSTNSRSSAIAP